MKVERLLRDARRQIAPRVAWYELDELIAEGALVVDWRLAEHRDRDGLLPGSVVVERSELELRLNPARADRLPQLTAPDMKVVIVGNEGYASSFAAANLRTLGLVRATDLAGGFQAWLAGQSRTPLAEVFTAR